MAFVNTMLKAQFP